MKEGGRFTRQESRVIELLLQGKSNKQIAALLGVKIRTAEFHLQNIYAKLNVTSRTEAVLKLAGEGLRESEGSEGPNGEKRRKTTVAKSPSVVENTPAPPAQRARKMPIAAYALILAALALLSVAALAWLTNWPPRASTVAPIRATTFAGFVTKTPTPRPTAVFTPTVPPTASTAATTTLAAGGLCNGPLQSKPAGPKANMTLVNGTQGPTTISLYLAKNPFGDCGYTSYVLASGASADVKEILPYGCYSLYALINDPKSPTHVTAGPVCITSANQVTFRVTYNKIVVATAP